MITARNNATVMSAVNNNQAQIRNQSKTQLARVNDLQTQQTATAKQAAATAAVANATQVTTQTVAVTNNVTKNGVSLYGWGSASSLPTLTNDGNTGSSWATGERNFINNLNTVVNFILTVLLDNGIIVP